MLLLVTFCIVFLLTFLDRLLKYANFSPDAEDIEAAEVLDGCIDFYIYKFILKDREVKNDYR